MLGESDTRQVRQINESINSGNSGNDAIFQTGRTQRKLKTSRLRQMDSDEEADTSRVHEVAQISADFQNLQMKNKPAMLDEDSEVEGGAIAAQDTTLNLTEPHKSYDSVLPEQDQVLQRWKYDRAFVLEIVGLLVELDLKKEEEAGFNEHFQALRKLIEHRSAFFQTEQDKRYRKLQGKLQYSHDRICQLQHAISKVERKLKRRDASKDAERSIKQKEYEEAQPTEQANAQKLERKLDALGADVIVRADVCAQCERTEQDVLTELKTQFQVYDLEITGQMMGAKSRHSKKKSDPINISEDDMEVLNVTTMHSQDAVDVPNELAHLASVKFDPDFVVDINKLGVLFSSKLELQAGNPYITEDVLAEVTKMWNSDRLSKADKKLTISPPITASTPLMLGAGKWLLHHIRMYTTYESVEEQSNTYQKRLITAMGQQYMDVLMTVPNILGRQCTARHAENVFFAQTALPLTRLHFDFQFRHRASPQAVERLIFMLEAVYESGEEITAVGALAREPWLLRVTHTTGPCAPVGQQPSLRRSRAELLLLANLAVSLASRRIELRHPIKCNWVAGQWTVEFFLRNRALHAHIEKLFSSTPISVGRLWDLVSRVFNGKEHYLLSSRRMLSRFVKFFTIILRGASTKASFHKLINKFSKEGTDFRKFVHDDNIGIDFDRGCTIKSGDRHAPGVITWDGKHNHEWMHIEKLAEEEISASDEETHLEKAVKSTYKKSKIGNVVVDSSSSISSSNNIAQSTTSNSTVSSKKKKTSGSIQQEITIQPNIEAEVTNSVVANPVRSDSQAEHELSMHDGTHLLSRDQDSPDDDVNHSHAMPSLEHSENNSECKSESEEMCGNNILEVNDSVMPLLLNESEVEDDQHERHNQQQETYDQPKGHLKSLSQPSISSSIPVSKKRTKATAVTPTTVANKPTNTIMSSYETTIAPSKLSQSSSQSSTTKLWSFHDTSDLGALYEGSDVDKPANTDVISSWFNQLDALPSLTAADDVSLYWDGTEVVDYSYLADESTQRSRLNITSIERSIKEHDQLAVEKALQEEHAFELSKLEVDEQYNDDDDDDNDGYEEQLSTGRNTSTESNTIDLLASLDDTRDSSSMLYDQMLRQQHKRKPHGTSEVEDNTQSKNKKQKLAPFTGDFSAEAQERNKQEIERLDKHLAFLRTSALKKNDMTADKEVQEFLEQTARALDEI